MKKSIFFWLYFTAMIILGVYFATRIITYIMGRGPVSNVQQVSIVSDFDDIDIEPIRMAIGINRGTNIKSVDLHQISKRVLAIPGIKNASTRLLPNGTVVIKVEPYRVAAQWSDGVYYYPVSSDGTKIDAPTSERDENTIVFQGKLPKDLTDIIKNVSSISGYIDYMVMVESRRWNIHTKNGTTIYLPENNPSVAINKISILNQTHELLSRKLDVIDMRDSARILVKTKK